MANAVYTGFLQAVLEAYFISSPPDLDIYVVGLDDTYVFDPSHETVADLGETAVAPPVAISGVTLTEGVIKADNLEEAWDTDSIENGSIINSLVIFAGDGGGYSQLMCYIDVGQEDSLPLTVAGNRVSIAWNPTGIMKI